VNNIDASRRLLLTSVVEHKSSAHLSQQIVVALNDPAAHNHLKSSAVTFMEGVFRADGKAAHFFYTNDMLVIIDILLRLASDAAAGDAVLYISSFSLRISPKPDDLIAVVWYHSW
jgi:hypothetical protein